MTTTTTTISTGTVTTAGSTTYVSGASSGIDTDALVTAGYEAKLAPADTIDVQITDNESAISAYEELQDLGATLETSLESLITSYGYSATDDSVYSQKTGYLATSDGGTVDNYLSVTADGTADSASYNIQITQIATAMKVSSESQSSKTVALGFEGTFSVSLENSTSLDISVTSDMTLSDIANSINETTATTGIKASIIKTADSQYSLVLSGKETGQTMTYATSSGDDIFKELGLTDTDGDFQNITQAAQDAIITIDGTQITSSSNTLDDVLEGVSITLYSVPATENTTITLEIDYDYSATKDAIQSFIDAYNNLRDFFITQQSTNSDGTASDDAVLYNDTLLKTLVSSVYTVINGTYGDDDTVSTLASMGITFDDSNKLEISDEDMLNNALLNNYTEVQSLFQTSLTSESDNVEILRNASTQTSLDFSLDIQVDSDGNISSVTADGDSNAFTVNGTRLIGKEGTIYEGITLVFVGTESEKTNISFSQGLADRLYNVIDAYTNTTDGIVQEKIDQTTDLDETLQIKSDRIKERAESYRDRLIDKYAAMEAAISSANSLLKQVQALFSTDSSSN
jgi:flagellar hook-associated protein 2